MSPEAETRPPKVRITVIIQKRYTFSTAVATGKVIKEKANIPADFSLHRRARGGIESLPDNEPIEVNDGDHFFAQPLLQPGLGHDEEK